MVLAIAYRLSQGQATQDIEKPSRITSMALLSGPSTVWPCMSVSSKLLRLQHMQEALIMLGTSYCKCTKQVVYVLCTRNSPRANCRSTFETAESIACNARSTRLCYYSVDTSRNSAPSRRGDTKELGFKWRRR